MLRIFIGSAPDLEKIKHIWQCLEGFFDVCKIVNPLGQFFILARRQVFTVLTGQLLK